MDTKRKKRRNPLRIYNPKNTKKNCQMQAFGVGDAGNHNLPFRIMSRGRSWSHQNPYCCYICSKPEPPEPELQRVVHAPDQKGCWKRGSLPSKLRSRFPRAFASQRCPAVFSPAADDDSPRAPSGQCQRMVSSRKFMEYFSMSCRTKFSGLSIQILNYIIFNRHQLIN